MFHFRNLNCEITILNRIIVRTFQNMDNKENIRVIMPNFKLKYRKFLIESIYYFLIMLIVFTLAQLFFMFRFVHFDTILKNVDSLPKLFFNGFRYNAQTISYFMLPVLLFFIIELIVTGFSKNKNRNISSKFNTYYFPISTIIGFLVLIIDNIFYANFNTHISIVFFDFFNENPLLLIKSMWQENHVGIILVLLSGVGFLMFWLFKKLIKRKVSMTKALSVLGFLYLPLLFIFLRGNLGIFPLRLEDCYVSTNMEINACTPNGFFMLSNALKEKSEAFSHLSPDDAITQSGFESVNQALSEYFELPVDTIQKYPVDHWLFPSTTRKLVKPMNVVIILTESWSNYLIDFNRPGTFDLLGPMAKHLQEDIIFRNFQSSGNSTIDCVEMLTVNTPYSRLFTSKYRQIQFPTSIALPFDSNGYNSEFISGIDISWRNLYTVLPNQGFKRVVGKYDILKERPTSKSNRTWGVYDHDMLNYVADRLDSSRKPQFYLCMTSTSHTPFEFPDDYKLSPLQLTDSVARNFTINKNQSLEYLTAFQYETWSLGNFMSRLKTSPLKDNTVVVITGDHNIRTLLNYSGQGMNRYQYSVPLYIYLPPQLRKSVKVNAEVYGSHSDILPTLASLLLSDVRYFALGQNLFDSTITKRGSISINQMQVLHSPQITTKKAELKANARNAISKWLFGKVIEESKRTDIKKHLLN